MTGNKAKWLAVAATVLAVGGCYPLEQAPLVYSSKQQIGVHVTSGTTDTPGLDIVIGYKGLDIAMVPVAVAKYCEAADHKDCLDEIYRMQVIAGGRQDPLSTKEIAKRMDALRKSITDNQRTFDSNEAEIKLTDIKLAQAQRRSDLLKEIETIRGKLDALEQPKEEVAESDTAEPDTAEPDTAERTSTLQSEKSKKEKELAEYQDVATFNIAREETAVARLRAQNTSLQAAIRNERDQLTSLEQQQQGAKAGSRADALSVYGTFTGNATGQAQQAGLSAGKVFATGVAAQYLAERAGTASCLASVAALAEKIKDDTEKRDALIAQAGALCTHRETEG